MQMSDSGTPKASVISAVDKMSIQELTALIQAAEEKRQKKLETAKHDLVAEFRAKATELGLSMDALISPAPIRKSKEDPGKKPPAKYRGPNGEEWSGRGRSPTWLTTLESQGRKREEFAV
jgi:DNA-binding protein H-NS